MARSLNKEDLIDIYGCMPCFDAELDLIYSSGGDAFIQIEESTLHFREPFVLEILKDHQISAGKNILRDKNFIGLRKSALMQAYFYANATYHSLKVEDHNALKMWYCFTDCYSPVTKSVIGTQFLSSMLIALTSVMLLFDPEHVLATNARKKALLAQLKGSSKTENKMIKDTWGILKGPGWKLGGKELNEKLFKEALDQDMMLSDCLLTSPLHKHSKSPNLWSHRKWLMKLRIEHGYPMTDLALGELRNIVMKAAETHPRNYHAWAYMRWIISLDRSPPSPDANSTSTTKPGKIGSILSVWVYKTMVEEMVTWCLKHPNDTSGWSFLNLLISPQPVGSAPIFSSSTEAIALLNDKFAHILGLTKKWKWRNESVWVFLRTVASSEHVSDELRCEFLRTIKVTVEDRSRDGANDFTFLIAAENWCREYGPVSSLERVGVLF